MTKRTAPKIVLQFTNKTCWAASLESWLESADKKRFKTQKELVESFEKARQSSKEPDRFDMDNPTLRAMVAGLGMTTQWVSEDDFAPWSIAKKLERSVLWVGFATERYSRWWHSVVLYGVESPPRKSTEYYVMNPGAWPHIPKVQGLDIWELRQFFRVDGEEALLGWQEGGPGRVL